MENWTKSSRSEQLRHGFSCKETHLPLPKAGTKPQHRRSSPLSGACAKMLLLAAISESGHEGSQLILRPTITEGLVVTEGRDPGLLSHMNSHDVGDEGGATEST